MKINQSRSVITAFILVIFCIIGAKMIDQDGVQAGFVGR